ncbi:MAG: OmpA family protein, partial [Proteobacteria bacterium]|nr:OmpA family protein [Pseudomonadota bacterium]
IQSIFTEEEAYVYRQGNNVLLETHAFDFKVGGNEIDSSNFDLLERIMKAINVFDNPKIIVIGHTDSTGSAALNMKLSQKRAQTVALFLKKIGKIDSRDLSVTGYGETRPVASNETKEGRKRNRRIEVSIINN